MLNLNPETVCFVIDKAKEFQTKGNEALAEEQPRQNREWGEEFPTEQTADTSYLEAKSVIDDLEPDQQVCLVALMWLGRGDYGADEWENAYAEAAENWNTQTADYLMSTPLVADYLEEGLALLGYSCQG